MKTFTIELTEQEIEEIRVAIFCRLGILETGTPLLRGKDAVIMEEEHLVKPLTKNKMELIMLYESILEKFDGKK